MAIVDFERDLSEAMEKILERHYADGHDLPEIALILETLANEAADTARRLRNFIRASRWTERL